MTIISPLYERKWTSKYRLEIEICVIRIERRIWWEKKAHHPPSARAPCVVATVKKECEHKKNRQTCSQSCWVWLEDTNRGQHTYLCNIKCKFKYVNILHKRMHTACRRFVKRSWTSHECEYRTHFHRAIVCMFRLFFFLYWSGMVSHLLLGGKGRN